MIEQRNEIIKTSINKLLLDISLSFHVSCSFYDIVGRQLGCCGLDSRSNFCRFIHFYDAKQVCHQSYMQGILQAEAKQKPHIYFCPFGLVNITFPILRQGEDPYFVTAGPLLYHDPDDFMINNILEMNYMIKPRARELRQRLNEVVVKSEPEVQSMSSLIYGALRNCKGPLHLEGENWENDNNGEYDFGAKALTTWILDHGNENEEKSFDNYCTRFQLFSLRRESGISIEELEFVIDSYLQYIFDGKEFSIIKYRSLKYISFLLEFAKKIGFHLELVFHPNGVDIYKIIQATDLDSLESALSHINQLFVHGYLSDREVSNKDIIFHAMHFIRNHYENISLSDVGKEVGLNPAYFSNIFKKETGRSYTSYLNKVRIEESKRLLRQNLPISDIAQRVGFSDQSYFTNVFKKYEGISPHRWKNAQVD